MRASRGLPPGTKHLPDTSFQIMHVLVVHSEPRFFREVKALLAEREAEGAYLPSLSDLRLQLEAQFPDLIVLEQCCLATGGEQLSAAFRHSSKLPIVFLTSADSKRISSGEERDRLIEILFHLQRKDQFLRLAHLLSDRVWGELLVHLQSQGEHTRAAQIIQVGQLRIHAGRMRVTLGDGWIKLPPIQFRILRHLALNTNVVVSHHDLASAVWGAEAADDETKRDLIKVHIVQLRRTLGSPFKNYIQAVRGQGYVLVDPESEE
jgi:DNA-binding response OmpR family regulator